MPVNGTWVGGYVLFEDVEVPGIRVAVCPGAVGAIMDADEDRDATLICTGGRVFKVDTSITRSSDGCTPAPWLAVLSRGRAARDRRAWHPNVAAAEGVARV